MICGRLPINRPRRQPESQDVQFYPHMAEFRRSDHGIGLTMEITVAPEDDVEIRRISLTNHSDRVRRIALTSYGEIILAPQAADARHPAFNKMFIESEYLPETNALLFRRRPRSTTEEPIYLAHSAIVSPGHKTTGAYETDRARFLGRGQTLRAPAALSPDGEALRNHGRDARSDHGSPPGSRAATACLGAGQLHHAGGEVSRQGAGACASLSRLGT